MSIYKIYCKNKNIKECYVGCSNNFLRRKSQHKTSCNNPKDQNYNYLLYKFIRENGGFDNWIWEVLEEVDCEDDYELRECERKWYDKIKPTLCRVVPNRTRKQLYYDCREINLLNKKKYYQENLEMCREKVRTYRKNNKEELNKKAKIYIKCEVCNKEYTYSNKHAHIRSKYHIDRM
mgnify:FL=1